MKNNPHAEQTPSAISQNLLNEEPVKHWYRPPVVPGIKIWYCIRYRLCVMKKEEYIKITRVQDM